jgi:hypothetical protein
MAYASVTTASPSFPVRRLAPADERFVQLIVDTLAESLTRAINRNIDEYFNGLRMVEPLTPLTPTEHPSSNTGLAYGTFDEIDSADVDCSAVDEPSTYVPVQELPVQARLDPLVAPAEPPSSTTSPAAPNTSVNDCFFDEFESADCSAVDEPSENCVPIQELPVQPRLPSRCRAKTAPICSSRSSYAPCAPYTGIRCWESFYTPGCDGLVDFRDTG